MRPTQPSGAMEWNIPTSTLAFWGGALLVGLGAGLALGHTATRKQCGVKKP